MRVPTYFAREALDVLGSFTDLGFWLDQWTLHHFFHETFRQQFKDREPCSEALLWFLSQVYTVAATEPGLKVPLETANQIAIDALGFKGVYIRISGAMVRSTKRCRREFGVSIRVALADDPYEVIPL